MVAVSAGGRGRVVEPVEAVVGGRAVDVAVAGLGGAVAAPADDLGGGGGVAPSVLRVAAVSRLGGHRDAEAVLVVDQRLVEDRAPVEAAPGGGAHERLLLGPREDGTADRVVHEGGGGARIVAPGLVDHRPHRVVAVDEAPDQADGRAVALGIGERGGDVGAVDVDPQFGDARPPGQAHLDEGVAVRHLVGPARQHRDGEPVPAAALGGGAGGGASGTRAGGDRDDHRGHAGRRPAVSPAACHPADGPDLASPRGPSHASPSSRPAPLGRGTGR